MTVIPVLDLQGGVVVRGVAGQRATYQPVVSKWLADARPTTVARMFVQRFGFSRVYVADLDAIAGDDPDWASLADIERAGLRLLVDAGVSCADKARLLLERVAELDGVVVGLESSPDTVALAEVYSAIGAPRSVFSLDLKRGQPLTAAPAWQDMSPLHIAETALAIGFRRLIVLDLASVGLGGGPSVLELCRTIRAAEPRLELISGGGVRDAHDVRRFQSAGCDAVLVASALHHGTLTPNDLCDD
jgi:phosphoribosylformimino-5-aminoimidazole carboxamide ribotide isomerase